MSMLMSPGVVRLTGREIQACFCIRYRDRASPPPATGITPALTALVWSPLNCAVCLSPFLQKLVKMVTTSDRPNNFLPES